MTYNDFSGGLTIEGENTQMMYVPEMVQGNVVQ